MTKKITDIIEWNIFVVFSVSYRNHLKLLSKKNQTFGYDIIKKELLLKIGVT